MRISLVSRVSLAAVLAAWLAAPLSAMPEAAPVPAPANRPLAPVILDPGHGGDDLGAISHGIQEKDIALAVARKLRDRLKGELPVVMTRETDDYVTLDRRVVDSVDWSGAIFVSIHLNQVRNKKTWGAVVYSYGPGPALKRRLRRKLYHRHPLVPPMPAPPRVEAKEGGRLASTIAKTLRADGFRAETAKNDYYVLKSPGSPSILIELGYLSNPGEAARLSDPVYQDKLAASLAKAIESYGRERALRAAATASAPAAAPAPSHL